MTAPRPATEPGVPPPPAAPDGGWTLDSLRALSAPQLDPLRYAYLQALARRTAAQQGGLRSLLDTRLAQALADCAQRCAALRAGAQPAAPAPLPAPPWPSPLAGLLARLDGLPPGVVVAAGAASAKEGALQPTAAGELKALQPFRHRWLRLSAEGQLARSVAQMPANPGPLNSQLLALRALQRMQALSPAYLQHFVAQVEALLWLDGADAATPPPAKPARRTGERKRKLPAGRA